MLHKHIKLLSDLLWLSIVTGVIRPSELFAPNVHSAEYSGFLLLRTFSFYSDFFLNMCYYHTLKCFLLHFTHPCATTVLFVFLLLLFCILHTAIDLCVKYLKILTLES